MIVQIKTAAFFLRFYQYNLNRMTIFQHDNKYHSCKISLPVLIFNYISTPKPLQLYAG